MRIASEAVILETIGVEEENDFTIKATGKAFRILIDGLYSNKIESMVREVTTNAFDSQVVAQFKGPFYVHAPNYQRPEFFVRDYGEGMSHDTVMRLYTTLFESNKEETNDLVGAFGLGSKSPFAYADQFSVSCYDGDIVRHYTAAIGEGGRPKIMLQGSEECVEPRGVRVTVTVKSEDFDAFARAINNISMGFEPAFDTNIDVHQRRGSLVFTGKDGTWSAYSNSSLPATWNVRQGCVIYPLTSTGGLKLPSDSGRKWLIDAPIGKIEVTSSRESVQYKPDVVAFLTERVERIVAEVEDLVWEQVKDIDSVVEFFNTHQRIRPGFITSKPVHPKTGLDGPHVHLKGHACVFFAAFDDYRKRWGYRVEKTINLTSGNHSAYYVMPDFSALLDASRDAGDMTPFSKSETRRISRMLRVYLEAHGKTTGQFVLGGDFTPQFWKCILPVAQLTRLSFDDLRLAAPQRRSTPSVAAPLQPAIRGLALALKAGDQTRCHEIATDLTETAWIDSELYRRKPEDAFRLAKRFGVTKLYIASPTAQAQVIAAKVPHLKEAIGRDLKAKHDIVWDDFVHLKGPITHSQNMANYAVKLEEADPTVYDKVTRIRSPVATVFKVLRPYIRAGLHKMEERERAFVELLLEDGGVKKAPAQSKTVMDFLAASKHLGNAYYHPTKRYMDALENARSKESIVAGAEGLIAVLRLVPIEMKFNT